MGSCVSSKNKKSVKNQNNRKISENDSVEDSQYLIKEFDPSLKSPFKKEDVDISLKVSKIVDSSKYHQPPPPNLHAFKDHPAKLEPGVKPRPPQLPYIVNKPLASPEIILDLVENPIPPPIIGHHTDRGLKKYNLVGELTKVTENFASEVFVNNASIGNAIVYEKGIIFLPKELTKNCKGSYFCEFFGKRHNLDLLTVLEKTCVFKLFDCDRPGIKFSSIGKVSDKMIVNIASVFIELNKVKDKKHTYNCSENIDDTFIGASVNVDENPCFIITSIKNHREVKILPLDQANKYLQRSIAPPVLPYQGLAVELYDQSRNKVSEVFQYKNYFFSYKQPFSNFKDKLLVMNESKIIQLDFLSLGLFYLLKTNQVLSPGLDKYELNNVEKIGKLFTNNGIVQFVQSVKNSLIFKSQSKVTITTNYIGTPLFGSNNEPFGIITNIESAGTIRISRLADLPSLFSSIDPSFHYYPIKNSESREINTISSYSSSSSRSSSSSSSSRSSSSSSSSSLSKSSFQNPDFIQAIRKNSGQGQEGDFEENFKGEFSLDLNPVNIEIENEEISYILIDSKLLKFSSKHYSPEIIKLPLNYDEKSSYSTTPAGLIAVSGKKAYLIKDAEITELHSLSTVHHFHGSVIHNDRLYIISGVGTEAVEFLDVNNLNSNWKLESNLPEIREKPAVCSSGDSIYVIGGEFHGSVTGTVFKFNSKWQTLTWTVPKAMGMGAIFTKNSLVIFGGKGVSAYNDFYYNYSINGERISTQEFPTPGLFHNKAIGRQNSVFSIVLSATQSLEYEDTFKLVSTAPIS